MPENKQKPDEMPVMEPCFRPDGSFDFGAFFRAPQVFGGILTIVICLSVCYLVTDIIKVESNFICMMVLMACGLSSFSGAESIVRYFNAQREARDRHC